MHSIWVSGDVEKKNIVLVSLIFVAAETGLFIPKENKGSKQRFGKAGNAFNICVG